jgi:transcriptional regulator of acetoin/glycerol metabolism
MTQADLVAALRAHRRAEERAKTTREQLDAAIRQAVQDGDWQIVDVAELTGWSRETIRKIAYSKD